MPIMNSPWIKSSFSNGNGGNNCVETKFVRSSYSAGGTCVETKFVKSRYSATNATCVEAAFVKSSYSSGATCVETACRCTEDRILVRDSKNPDGPVLTFARKAFFGFLDAVAAGDFDHL